MYLMSVEEMDVIRAHAAEETIGKAFECMTEAGQLYCCALSLLPSATAQELLSLWDGAHLHDALSELTRFFFVEQSNGNYRLTTGAATYIREQYAIDPRIQRLFQQLFDSVSKQAKLAVTVAEQVLLREWDLPETRLKWIADFWKTGLAQGHFAQWCTIFESVLPNLSPELWMAYGICLRRGGRWDVAHHALRRASHECGLKGDFSTQAEVLVEWATLARFQGDYTQAIELLAQAERCNVVRDEKLLARIRYERSQIALDQEDGYSALASLEGLDATLDVEAARCEAFLILGEYEHCRVTAKKVLEHRSPDRRFEASLYTLIARSYELEGHADVAIRYFSLALTILENSEDVSAIARAQANLAASLLLLGKGQQAQPLLERAKPVFAMLEDRVGYYATTHNQRLADIYRAGLS